MNFECAATIDSQRCASRDQGDTTYLGALTFCASHQEAFEDLVRSRKLADEVTSARVARSELGKALAQWKPVHSTADPARRDMRYEASVYFLRCGDYIKIGYSAAPHMRLRQIKSDDGTKRPSDIDCASTVLVQTEPGGFNRERELHAKFAHLRHTGEWFTEAPELTDYIRNIERTAA